MRHGTHIISYERNTEEFLFQFFCVAVWRGRAGHHSPVVLFAPAALCLAATCSVCEKHQACRTRWAWPFPAGGCRCLLHSFPSTSCKGGGHFRSIALAPHPFISLYPHTPTQPQPLLVVNSAVSSRPFSARTPPKFSPCFLPLHFVVLPTFFPIKLAGVYVCLIDHSFSCIPITQKGDDTGMQLCIHN